MSTVSPCSREEKKEMSARSALGVPRATGMKEHAYCEAIKQKWMASVHSIISGADTGKASLTYETGAASVPMRQNEANGSTAKTTHNDLHLVGSPIVHMPVCTTHEPPRLRNLWNTCYMSAILQGCRQVMRQATWHDITSSSPCPLRRSAAGRSSFFAVAVLALLPTGAPTRRK